MKNIMIREDVYDKLKDIKGEMSFSDIIGTLFDSNVENRRKVIRSHFGSKSEKDMRDFEKTIMEVHRIAKGRLF